MKFNNNLSLEDYVAVVEAIADGFFNENGEYVPHIGRMVTLMVFCDYCMKESAFSDVENPDMDVIYANKVIMGAYKKALYISDDELCFANAYSDAMEIVEYRKNSLTQATQLFAGIIKQSLSPNNLAKLYELSDRFKEISEGNKDNLVPLFQEKAD